VSISKTIIYLRNYRSSSCREKLDGVMRYAKARTWRVQVLDREENLPPLRKMVAEFNAAGCICDANYENELPKGSWFSGVHTVLLDYSVSAAIPSRCGVVRHDSVATAHMAAKNLLSLDCACYGFVPWVHSKRSWSDVRRDAFVSAVESAGAECRVFDGRGDMTTRTGLHHAICSWLKNLPKRCGIFAANDEIGEMVVSACRKMNISVPGDVAVLGVDNDESICENTIPSLSSIQVDFERAGYLAAEMLDCMMEGVPTALEAWFGPMGVIWRQSMRIMKCARPKIAEAIEHIRLHACEGLKARDVVALMGVSRRLAEMRFMEATGHSILEEIHRVRFERIFNFLRRPNCKIDAVAGFCGYESIETLRNLFKKRTGMTMSEWRHKNGLSSPLRK